MNELFTMKTILICPMAKRCDPFILKKIEWIFLWISFFSCTCSSEFKWDYFQKVQVFKNKKNSFNVLMTCEQKCKKWKSTFLLNGYNLLYPLLIKLITFSGHFLYLHDFLPMYLFWRALSCISHLKQKRKKSYIKQQ